MSSTWAMVVFVVVLVGALVLVHRPFGDYMYRVYTTERHSRAERVVYRVIGVNPDVEQRWNTYLRGVLAFSLVGVLFLYAFLRLQNHLLLNLGFPAMGSSQAFNTAASFVTNTNWQSYSGESALGYLVQMAGIAVQNFLSAAVGMAVAVALIRGFARQGHRQARQLLGRPGPHLPADPAANLVRHGDRVHRRGDDPELPRLQTVTTITGGKQTITGGPVASPGSHQGVRHQRRRVLQRQLLAPVREPDHMDQLVGDLPPAGIRFSLPRTFGRMVGDKRQGRAIVAVMALLALISRRRQRRLPARAPRHGARSPSARPPRGRRRVSACRNRLSSPLPRR